MCDVSVTLLYVYTHICIYFSVVAIIYVSEPRLLALELHKRTVLVNLHKLNGQEIHRRYIIYRSLHLQRSLIPNPLRTRVAIAYKNTLHTP